MKKKKYSHFFVKLSQIFCCKIPDCFASVRKINFREKMLKFSFAGDATLVQQGKTLKTNTSLMNTQI